MDTKSKIIIAAPVYNEINNIEEFLTELLLTINDLFKKYEFRILLVNDGSDDGTEEFLEEYCEKSGSPITIVNLTRNFGHTAACAACLKYAKGDAVILMDSDLQDDPKAIPIFLEMWEKGNKVVYAIRTKRYENLFARILFKSFYRFFNMLSSVKIPLDAGNYSLIDKCAYNHISNSFEKNDYFPGIRALAGFKQIGIPIARRRRPDKKSKVGYSGLFKLARDAIFSFSFLPIRIFNVLGCIALLVCLFITIHALYFRLFTDVAIPSWASQIITISFFGGVNLLGIGVIGEYVARIYDNIKSFPGYFVKDILENNDK